jgi:hypothetical protein
MEIQECLTSFRLMLISDFTLYSIDYCCHFVRIETNIVYFEDMN